MILPPTRTRASQMNGNFVIGKRMPHDDSCAISVPQNQETGYGNLSVAIAIFWIAQLVFFQF